MLKFSEYKNKESMPIDNNFKISLSEFDVKNAKMINKGFFKISPEVKITCKETIKAKSFIKLNMMDESSQFEEGNEYYISHRKGNFNTQVDYAMSKIYRIFLDYQPDNHIVRDDISGEVYNASRAVKNLTSLHPIMKGKPIQGLATILCLSYFFGDSDLKGNYGFQIKPSNNNEYNITAYKYDNEYFLDEELLSVEIPSSLSEIENEVLSLCSIFLKESFCKNEIENTLFKIIENKQIIRKIIEQTISSTKKDEALWLIDKISEVAKQFPKDRDVQKMNESHQEILPKLLIDDDANYGAKKILKLLDQRFDKLSQILNPKSKVQPSFK